MRPRRVAAVLALAALGMAACSSPPPSGGPTAASGSAVPTVPGGLPPTDASPPGGTATPAGPPDHVVVVVFENKSYQQVAAAGTPWLRGVVAQAAVFTDAHAVTHPSQPNYLALFSGSTQGITDDHCPADLGSRPNLARSLLDAGRTFTGYSEGLPAPGSTACGSGRYARKHNPWVDFANLPSSVNQPLASFPTDPARLPTVSFVVPDLCDDMHDCPIGTGDSFAARHLDGYRQWASSHHSLLIVTFDEDDNSSDNRILTMVTGAGIHPATRPERVDHYSVLRTIEDCYGLPAIGRSASAAPIAGVC